MDLAPANNYKHTMKYTDPTPNTHTTDTIKEFSVKQRFHTSKCPICRAVIDVKYNVQLNVHVECCIEGQHSQTNQTVKFDYNKAFTSYD